MVRTFFGFIGRRGFELADVFENFYKEISGLYYLTRATLYCTFIEPLRGKPNKWRPVWTQMEEVGGKVHHHRFSCFVSDRGYSCVSVGAPVEPVGGLGVCRRIGGGCHFA